MLHSFFAWTVSNFALIDSPTIITSFKSSHICGLNSSPTSLTIYLLKKKKNIYHSAKKIKRQELNHPWVEWIKSKWTSYKKIKIKNKKNPSEPELSAYYDKPRSITSSSPNAVVLKTYFTVILEGILYLVSHQTKSPLCFFFSHQTLKRNATPLTSFWFLPLAQPVIIYPFLYHLYMLVL